MAKKRFTDIEIWDKEWYMDLSPTHKCLIKYIFDKCDAAGCWKPNWKLASLHINDKVSFGDLKSLPKDQYEVLENGKIFIPDFVKFQYGKLSRECRPHLPIILLIEKNGLYERFVNDIEDSGSSVKALRKRLTEPYKKEIFEHDNYQCQYCGDKPSIDNIFIDHIIPLSKGGDNSPVNLTTACKSCNSKKHDDDVFEFLSKYGFAPLNNLSKKLNTLSKKVDTLKEKEIEIDEEEDEDEEIGEQKKTNKIKFVIRGLGEMSIDFYSKCEVWQMNELKEFLTRSQGSFEAIAMSNKTMNNVSNFNTALQEFVNMIQGSNDYKESPELRKYFRNWISKKNGTLESFLIESRNRGTAKANMNSFI